MGNTMAVVAEPGTRVPRLCRRWECVNTSDEVNMSVALFPNRSNYEWLDRQAEELARVIGLFADSRILRLLRRMHEKEFPREFHPRICRGYSQNDGGGTGAQSELV